MIVRETRSVNELSIENVSGEEVYVQSGDIVKGGQQDRMLVVDLILPSHSGTIPIAAFCVENGRWSQRGSEAVTVFSSSSNSVASRQVKLAAKAKSSQGEVWREVAAAQDKLSANVGNRVNNEASPTSFQLALENKEVQANADTYIKAFGGLLDERTDVARVQLVQRRDRFGLGGRELQVERCLGHRARPPRSRLSRGV